MLGRVATYVVPSVAVAVTAVVLLGPGARRGVVGARLRGEAVAGARVLSCRLQTVRRELDIEDAVALDGLALEVASAGAPVRTWRGSTGSDGVGEATVELPALGEPLELRLLDARGGELAAGRVVPAAPAPARRRSGKLVGSASGDLHLELFVPRGALAAPFPEVVRVVVDAPAGAQREGIAIRASGAGLEVSPATATTDAQGVAELRVTPFGHTVELTVEAAATGRAGRWEGYLPVVPGAIWAEPRTGGSSLVVRSQAPRSRAYVSAYDERGRVFGAAVPMTREEGGWVGTVALGASSPLFAVVAGDPFEQGAGTVVWPLGAADGTFESRPLSLLLDGLPAAEAREAARARRARSIAVAIVAAAALFEVLLLFARSRKAQRRLEAHLRSAADPDEEPAEGEARLARVASERQPGMRLVAAAALVALAFAAVAWMALLR